MASHNDPHVFTPPHDHHSPTKPDILSGLSNGNDNPVPPTEIPKRESIPSASDVPSQAVSPPGGLQPFNTVKSPPLTNGAVHPWLAGLNGSSQSNKSPEPERNYLDLYQLKQAQLEQAEKAHKEMMEEVLKARTRAEELAGKILDELRLEVKSVRRVEEGLRGKVEEQLQREREAWNAERELLMSKMKSLEDSNTFFVRLQHCEQENQALRMRIEQLKHRCNLYEVKGTVSGELSPGPEDSGDFYSPTRHASITSNSTRRIASPNGRNGRQTSVDRHAFFGSRRQTPTSLRLQEVPFEPPASAIPPLSPPPAAYRRHAGHTPGASVALMSPRAHDVGDHDGADTPRQPNFGSLAGVAAQNGIPAAESSREETLRRANAELMNAPDDDPPLKGALGLRNNPEESSLFLDLLNKKLADVSDDPAGNKPKVLKRDIDELSVISESVDGQSTIDPDDSASNVAPAAVPKKTNDEEAIPLRLKPSMNFGAPLGHVRSG